jgi:hypothetical protein
VVLLSNQSDTDVPPAQSRTTTLVPTTTLASTIDPDETAAEPTVTPTEALAVSNAYFFAYNNGDADGVMALFTPNVIFSNSIGGAMTRTSFEEILVWNTAQGATLTFRGCEAQQDEEGPLIVVTCRGETHDAQTQAVNALPVITNVRLVITPDGISQHGYVYGSLDFLHVGDPFEKWMLTNNPNDAENTGFGSWSNLEEAREFGLLVAEYSDEWAEYLKANNCTYLDDC